MDNPIGIRKYDYVEFYVGSARMVAWCKTLDQAWPLIERRLRDLGYM